VKKRAVEGKKKNRWWETPEPQKLKAKEV